MAELVDAADLKSADSNIVRVQVPLRPPTIITPWFNQGVLYYIIITQLVLVPVAPPQL